MRYRARYFFHAITTVSLIVLLNILIALQFPAVFKQIAVTNLRSTRAPPGCFPKVMREFRGDRPTLNLQHVRDELEVWKLIYCCVHHQREKNNNCTGDDTHDETVIVDGRYGACNRSCYASFTSRFSKIIDLAANANNAFFVETSGASNVNFRQACSIESLARLNPDVPVYVLFTSENINLTATSSVALLENYKNVHFVSLYPLGEYFAGTEMERWYFCSGWNYGQFAISHLSDALRYMILFKYGGYYFDSDVIMIRPLPRRFKNFVAFQNEFETAAGGIHIEKGHPLAKVAVQEFVNEYNADGWTTNGPEVLSRAIKSLCKVDHHQTLTSTLLNGNDRAACQGIRLLSAEESFYPIPWQDHDVYFREQTSEDDLPDLEISMDGRIVGAHVWNKLSAESMVHKNLRKKQLYAHLAATKCPKTFQVAPETF